MAQPTPSPPHPPSAPSDPVSAPVPEAFEVRELSTAGGLPRRVVTVYRHALGLVYGQLLASVRDAPARKRRGLGFRVRQLLALLFRPLYAASALVKRPFPEQLRRRLELLGPTYIKLGQVLSLRSDILPKPITEELKLLLDRLPVVPFSHFMERVEETLGRPADEVFDWIDPEPLASASIAQIHRGTLRVQRGKHGAQDDGRRGTYDSEEGFAAAASTTGPAVILKVVKPGIRETLERDAKLLWLLGRLLQWAFPRYQPRRMIDEFVTYTRREVDLRLEADNAEIFAANFEDQPEVAFPHVYRHASGRNLLTMEYFAGERPDSLRARNLSLAERKRLIELGAEAIVRMIYRDGFFHADLHPGNLIVLPGPKLGFIDLGMVGRFDDELRRGLLYYFYCLVMGDAENAARYLAATATAGAGSQPAAFRREVAEICQRWHRTANFQDFSLGQLIMECVERGARHRMYFPVEMVLMTKALVTFEGVGQILEPDFDVVAVAQPPTQALLLQQLNPLRLVEAGLRNAPEMFDAFIKTPALVSEAMRLLEQQSKRPPEQPFAGLQSTLFGGFCIVAGAILLVAGGSSWSPQHWGAVGLFVLGGFLATRRRA